VRPRSHCSAQSHLLHSTLGFVMRCTSMMAYIPRIVSCNGMEYLWFLIFNSSTTMDSWEGKSLRTLADLRAECPPLFSILCEQCEWKQSNWSCPHANNVGWGRPQTGWRCILITPHSLSRRSVIIKKTISRGEVRRGQVQYDSQSKLNGSVLDEVRQNASHSCSCSSTDTWQSVEDVHRYTALGLSEKAAEPVH
jgi:hypothetical protein